MLTLLYGVEDLLKESINVTFSGKSVLMLGKQDLNLSKVELFVIAKRLGAKLNYELLRPHKNGTDSCSFFLALGFSEVHAMDISPYENADIIFDLNSRDMLPELVERFDYIIDGGTTEHVFDFAQALRNISKMLKVGGKVFHYIPSAVGWFNHGYYNLSPSLLQDFYESNGYQIETINIHLSKKQITDRTNLGNWLSTEPDYRIYNFREADVLPGYNGLLRCIAKKIHSMNGEPTNPKQTQWYGMLNGDWLLEMWITDLNLAEDNPAIGIVGINSFTGFVLSFLRYYQKFKKDKIKAIFVDDVVSAPKNFQDYPVLGVNEISTSDIKVIFLLDFDRAVYERFINLNVKGIKVVWLGHYWPVIHDSF